MEVLDNNSTVNDTIDDVDAIFNMVKKIKEQEHSSEVNKEEEIKESKEVLRLVESKYDSVKKRSVGTDKKTPTEEKKKNPELTRLGKVSVAVSLAVTLLAGSVLYSIWTDNEEFGLMGLVNWISTIQKEYTREQNINKGIDMLVRIMDTNLRYSDGNNYKYLDIDTPEELYICSRILHEEEFNKVLKTIEYTDPEGNKKSYSSFEEYLKINGYEDEKDFERKAKEAIGKSYEETGMTKYYTPGVPYEVFGSELGRGGRS